MDEHEKHHHDDEHECTCGCGCDCHDEDEMVEYDTVNITFEDDKESECAVLDHFAIGEKEYMVLLPLDDNEEELVYIYRYTDDGDGAFTLDVIEDEDELDEVCDKFEERAELDEE